MTVPLTKETLEAIYELVRATPPFNRWNLPESEDIRFVVVKTQNLYGYYDYNRKTKEHTIGISANKNGYLHSLIETMSHELIHVHERQTGMCKPSQHSAAFRRIAAQVCKIHGFDPKRFC